MEEEGKTKEGREDGRKKRGEGRMVKEGKE